MFKIRKSVLDYSFYYFCHDDTRASALDSEVAVAMELEVEDFRKLMLKDFNGRIRRITGEVWFASKQDAENALGYITGIMVANKLKKAK
jgi:hypothetical protein